ncbi:GWxTD domain-containing protein [Rhodocytophaga rosea]|uniref:GWxTD domain-containing protein n=1 Tax=Rhodocytophaga rosea TaxID=2704465 RepID=A0A6C0GJ10_9BACT|nr:GWxTD domain-containing protein [Rhodocytophaga rosea]QHT67945.1 GWxTD domain-containing protein [Rhodocytophaga rosea]
MKNIFVFAMLLLLGACARRSGERTSQQQDENFGNEAPLIFQSKVLDNDSTSRVYVTIEWRRIYDEQPVQRFIKEFSLGYIITPDYTSKEVIASRTLAVTEQTLQKTGPGSMAFHLDVVKLTLPNAVLTLHATDTRTGQRVTHMVALKPMSGKFHEKYAVFKSNSEFPGMKTYFYQQDTLQIKSLNGVRKQMTVYRYTHNFDPALSPMATAGKNVTKTLQVDTMFTLPTNALFVLAAPGLYFFREDTNAVNGIGMLIVDKRFPRMTRPDDLVKPLIYISTNNEIKELVSTQAPKRTLDTYWLRLAGNNESKARRTIRAYYRRVAQANQQFTTYKEGWKTDMGMVHIVFGKPDQITRTREKEVWTYTQNANFSEINFTFVKRPNQFVDDHYELMRYVEYEPIWYPTVEEWRTGIVER